MIKIRRIRVDVTRGDAEIILTPRPGWPGVLPFVESGLGEGVAAGPPTPTRRGCAVGTAAAMTSRWLRSVATGTANSRALRAGPRGRWRRGWRAPTARYFALRAEAFSGFAVAENGSLGLGPPGTDFPWRPLPPTTKREHRLSLVIAFGNAPEVHIPIMNGCPLRVPIGG